MAFQKHNFVTGHVLTANEMNEIEDGIKTLENANPSAVVTSVNGQTGVVNLNYDDVGALPKTTKIPSKTNELTNDSGYITNATSDLINYFLKSETYTREDINKLIAQVPKFSISVVSALPADNISNTTIYLVGGGESGDLYTEYIYVDGAWELLGKQQVDLTGYAKETWVTTQLGSYLKASELESAINTALAQAAASGQFDGEDGVGIAGVSVSREPDEYGYYYITLELTDGHAQAIPYRNGKDGKTPVRGTDYWTDADQEAIVQQVIAALGTPVFGTVDADNNIILSGALADGTYVVKYEDAEGNVTEIGTIVHSDTTNLADPSSAEWLVNKRLNSSGAVVDAAAYGAGGAVTNFIPCKNGDVIRVKGLNISNYYADTNGTASRGFAYFYAENKSTIIAKNVPADGNGWVYSNGIWTYTVGTSLTAVSGSNSDIRYARLTGIYYSGYTAQDVVITVNQEIS